ncbi:hypothetical protein NXS15_01890 [Mycoplasma sp. CSL7475-4]|uniref:hypothetical protein n=1 Tax=Mycoplasma sp. CSL7475-4 TaxID=2973942 RepID=UPI00216ABD4B|nr:hypothetical protein [Mycoplasma sp. CSL7475-4]MCS4536870.1 hypothetical protein [Mycoplasma sp. CSL7475-4]
MYKGKLKQTNYIISISISLIISTIFIVVGSIFVSKTQTKWAYLTSGLAMKIYDIFRDPETVADFRIFILVISAIFIIAGLIPLLLSLFDFLAYATGKISIKMDEKSIIVGKAFGQKTYSLNDVKQIDVKPFSRLLIKFKNTIFPTVYFLENAVEFKNKFNSYLAQNSASINSHRQ